MIAIPAPGQGYQITKSDSGQAAPDGYEGRTDTSTETAVGNTPATAGKHIVAKFQFGNQIKTCPLADGTAEGTGVFSLTLDYTNAQSDGTSTTHIQVHADAKYKGEVGDDALLHGPVNAEINYTYSQTGSFRDKSGAIATTAPTNSQQHITIPFTVGKNLSAPTYGTFSGGDPTQGHYGDAFGVGTALTYWAGFYYSVAQLKWYGGEVSGGNTAVRGGQCAEIVFDPPTSMQPASPGSPIKVKAEIKAKTGGGAGGEFVEVRPFGNGSVTPGSGATDAGRPMTFTFTPPSQAKVGGFYTAATSRAGTAIGQWETGVGGKWSGRISYVTDVKSPDIHDQMRSGSGYAHYETQVTFTNGVGTTTYHGEVKSQLVTLQNALRGGAKTVIKNDSSDVDGTVGGSIKARVEVDLDPATGTYRILPMLDPIQDGKQHTTYCHRENCTTRDLDFPMYVGELVIHGKLDNPKHLQGSKSEHNPSAGGVLTGDETTTVTWDLSPAGAK